MTTLYPKSSLRTRGQPALTWRSTITDAAQPNEPGSSNQRPPYLDRCEEMSFAQLKRFIHDAVERLSYPSASDDHPRSQEELLALCDLLSAKAEEPEEETSPPEHPTYDGPSHPGWTFTPSRELDALYRKRRKAERRLEYELKHGDSEVFLGYLRDELDEVEREIAPIQTSEEQEHAERLREYEEVREPYRRRLRQWQAEVEQAEKRREAKTERHEAVRRTYQKVRRAFEPTRASGPRRIGTLPFEIAPPGERTNDHVYAYYREVLRRGQIAEFDQERLDKILTLPRRGLLKGKAGFYGYIVLEFDHTEKVLLECPVYGNALYVLDSSDERLLRMTKQDLIASDEAKRIIHTGDWFSKVKRELGIE